MWGTTSDNIVWGTDCGGADCDNIVWGTFADGSDNIVWGTADLGDNIVWGTSTADDDDEDVRATSSEEPTILFEDPNRAPANYNTTSFESLIDDVMSLIPNLSALFGSSTTGGR